MSGSDIAGLGGIRHRHRGRGGYELTARDRGRFGIGRLLSERDGAGHLACPFLLRRDVISEVVVPRRVRQEDLLLHRGIGRPLNNSQYHCLGVKRAEFISSGPLSRYGNVPACAVGRALTPRDLVQRR